jgi:hypothetical protein
MRHENLQLIYNSIDAKCRAMLRITRTPFFFALCKLFRQGGLVANSINSPIEEQVSMFLHVVGLVIMR